jgi:hypothetical protein
MPLVVGYAECLLANKLLISALEQQIARLEALVLRKF